MRRILGSLLITVAVLVALLPVGLGFYGVGEAETWAGQAFALWLLAGLLLFVGRRLAARGSQAVLDEDPRPPVLYLRPFRRDTGDNLRMFMRLVTANRELGGSTREEELIQDLSGIGPVVALGKPGEWMPPIGAARMYVPEEDDWHESVDQLLKDAQLVVVRGSGSAGLLWEIQRIVATVDPAKVQFAFDTPSDYDRFYEWAWALFPGSLPEQFPGHSVSFNANWSIAELQQEAVVQDEPDLSSLESPPVPRPRSPLSPLTAIMIASTYLILSVALGLVITAESREAIPGWSYSIVSVGVIFALMFAADTLIGAAIELRFPGLMSIGHYGKPSMRLLEIAFQLGRLGAYALPDHMKAVFDRASAVEDSLIARKIAARETDDGQQRQLNGVTPQIDDLFQTRLALNVLGRAAMLSTRLASVGVLGVAVLATTAATDRLSVWVMVSAAAGLGATAGLITSRWLCHGPIAVTYWPGDYDDLNQEEQSTLDLVRGKPLRVMPCDGRSCSGFVASRFFRFSALTASINLILLPIVFFGAWVVLVIWPGGEGVGLSFWSGAIAWTALGAIIYVSAGWLTARSAVLFTHEARARSES